MQFDRMGVGFIKSARDVVQLGLNPMRLPLKDRNASQDKIHLTWVRYASGFVEIEPVQWLPQNETGRPMGDLCWKASQERVTLNAPHDGQRSPDSMRRLVWARYAVNVDLSRYHNL